MIEIRIRSKSDYPRMIDWYPMWWMNDNLKPIPVFIELTVCKNCDHDTFNMSGRRIFCKACDTEYIS